MAQAHKVRFDRLSIRQIRQVFYDLANTNLPLYWLDDWLLVVLDKPKAFLITDADYMLNDEQAERLATGVDRLLSGEPLAYLLGQQGFWGREFVVNQHTLIPRADTEILVQTVLDFIGVVDGNLPNCTSFDEQNKNKTNQSDCKNLSILDLGTGTGCIAITLAKELPQAKVLAVDYSEQALQVAMLNAQRLQADNCQFVQSDWYQSVCGQFDVIVSNPPYIRADDHHLSNLVHEPITALVADDAGLADIIKIINGAKNHLKTGGLIAIEHGYDQADQVCQLLKQAGFEQVATVQDYGANDRVSMGRWFG